MTTTTQQKPIPDTRYVKQEVPQGDFAAGERTEPPVPEIDDFASGEHTLPASTTAGDFASGEHTLLASTTAGDFASGEQTLPIGVPVVEDFVSVEQTLPENPELAAALPVIAIVPEVRA
jgi:hypothetical protein